MTFTLLFSPALFIFFLVIVLASIGKSLGIRRLYVSVLIKVFEFGQGRIDHYEKNKSSAEEYDSESSNGPTENGNRLIERDIAISATEGISLPSNRPEYSLSLKKEFHISDNMYFAKCGMEAICEDEVTQRFTAEELRSWNLLTRTDRGYHFISMRLTILWCLGCIVRYCVLLPFRFVLCCIGLSFLISSTAFIGYLPDSSYKKGLNEYVTLVSHRILARACSAIVTYHNRENMAKGGICVANHTSPIDVIILSCDNCYAMVGQSHGGLLGVLQRAMSRATAHIWFERSEMKDRILVTQRLKEHVENKDKLPILIFPEGTCINNTSVMMFKKGGFEVGSTIYPVAVKYDSRFGDPFWNSSEMGMVWHIFEIMTSWALVAEVWYLPPMRKIEDEDAVQFANRVKKEIAKKGGLVELEWDGQLKRMRAKECWKSKSQADYSNLLKID
ncbi:hypothetical protein ScPMuIL_001888 [Solemya velum]